jgi:O-methyltransferase
LFLFDTFAGFPAEDRELENLEDERFQDTSVGLVERALRERPGVVIRKGRFPETIGGLEDRRFAFVLLDLDVYRPTLAGLEFFYPRMNRGGYLFVHDFNSPESNAACHRAVEPFLGDKPELPVEIPDLWGSVMIRRI